MGWFLTITEEMRAAGLNGNALLIYALIHGYSQQQQGCYYGSQKATAEIVGCSAETVRVTLNNLLADGFIERFEFMDGGVHRVAYRITPKIWATQEIWADHPRNLGPTTQETGVYNYRDIDTDNKRSISNAHARENFDFRGALLELGVTPETADAWLDVRRKTKAVNSEIAFRDIAAQIQKSGFSAEECIRKAAAKSWRGFEAAWMSAPQQQGRGPAPYESVYEHNARVLNEMFGDKPDEQ